MNSENDRFYQKCLVFFPSRYLKAIRKSAFLWETWRKVRFCVFMWKSMQINIFFCAAAIASMHRLCCCSSLWYIGICPKSCFFDKSHLCCWTANFLWSTRDIEVKFHEESKYFIRIFASRFYSSLFCCSSLCEKVQNLRVYRPTRITTRARQNRCNGLES